MSTYISPTAGQVTATGFSAPTLPQIISYLQSQYLAIFGADVYLGNDAQDFQLMAVFAVALNDANGMAAAVYNSFSPSTAQGVGLSSMVQINGISRLASSFSSAITGIFGVPGATITNGQVIDPAGNIWALPASVTIPAGGSLLVSAVCTVPGAISLAANVFSINTPTFGWTSVTNAAGVPGAPVETDAALRVRQAGSVALPAQTIFEGIVAAIANTAGIGRVVGYENNTAGPKAVPGGSIPANNLAFIAEGGTNTLIWNAIFSVITPGIPTYAGPGAQTTTITDANGSTRLISYMAPVEQAINTSFTLNPGVGYASSTILLIQAAVNAYIASLPIGSLISIYKLVAVAQLIGTPAGATFELVQPTAVQANGPFSSTDLQLNYNFAPVPGTCSVNVI